MHEHLLNQLGYPGKGNKFYFFSEGLEYDIGPNIFVFGSNEKGVHGLGAAKTAFDNYGARMGTGYGLMNKCFALPTKDVHLRSLSLQEIAVYATDFVLFTHQNPHLGFYLTPVGTGYAGYKHEAIAPLFRGVENCWIPHVWQPFL